MSTTYHFSGTVAWNRLGSFITTGGGLSTKTITDPATGLVPAGLTQGGVSVTKITADVSNGTWAFTTTDVPAVLVDWGAGPNLVSAAELPGMIVTAAAATDSAVATLLGNPASSTRSAGDGVYNPKSPTRRIRYVDQVTGNDSNTGASPGKSFATIQAAVTALGTDGGRVLVHDGTYAPFTVTTSGVEIESLGGRRKTIIQTASTSLSGVTFLGASAVATIVQLKLKGFTVAGPGKASGGTGVGLSVKWTSVDFTAEDCWFTSWGSHGVQVTDAYSITFRNCLADQNGGDGFNGATNFNNVTFDRTISILNNGNGYAITGGTTCLFLNADAESNVKAGFDIRYVTAANLIGCHLEKNGTDTTSPNIYLHYRSGLSEKTTSANVRGCLIQGSSVTARGLVIDGASRTNVEGNWFSNHVTDHVQTTSNADRTWIGPNNYAGTGTELTDGSASTVRMDYDYTNLCARTDVLRYAPRSTNPASLAQGQTWWSSTTDQFKARGSSKIHTVFTGYQATATLDFPSTAAGAVSELTVTVTGAVAGDSVTIGPPTTLNTGLMVSGFVSAADTVTVRVFNGTGAAIDPASAGWKVNVIKS